jgi:integrase
MPIDDLWYLKKFDEHGKPLRSKRYGRGKRWRVRWNDPLTGEPAGSLAFARKPDAEAKELEIQSSIQRGMFIDPTAGRVTVAEYAEKWYGSLVLRVGTLENLERYIRLHVEPVIGHLPMGGVRSATIKGWFKNRLEHPLAASHVNNIYANVVSPLFEQAVVDGVIGRTPCVGITLAELPQGTYDLPTAEQVRVLSESVPDEFHAALLLAAGCGWRAGEVFGLEVDGIDFLRREVHVRHQMRDLAGHPPGFAPPKTRTSYRTSELPAVVGTALARHLELYPPREIIVPDRTDAQRPVERPSRLLFVNPSSGQPLRRSTWSVIWRAACEKASIAPGLFTLRSFRHYFATVLIYGGKNVKTVQLAMGHATPSITMDTYLGYWPNNEQDSTRDLLDTAFSAGFTASVPKVIN